MFVCDSGLKTYQWYGFACLRERSQNVYDMYDIPMHSEVAINSVEEQNASMVLVCERL